MSDVIQLTSVENPRVKAVVRLLREHKERRATGCFVAEGVRQISRAIDAGLRLRELYFCPQLSGSSAQAATDFQDLSRFLPERLSTQVQHYHVTAAIMHKLAYRENPESHLAVFEQPKWSWDDISRRMSSSSLLLVAVGMTKPGNLGAVVRTASAAGAAAVLLADAVVDPFNPNTIHASTAAVFTLPVVAASSDEIVELLCQYRIQIVAAIVDAKLAYTQADMTRPTAIVIGPEDTGLNSQWQAAARQHGQAVSIPMAAGAVDSLNASNAAAILLFEAVRQRRSTNT